MGKEKGSGSKRIRVAVRTTVGGRWGGVVGAEILGESAAGETGVIPMKREKSRNGERVDRGGGGDRGTCRDTKRVQSFSK